jgi:hypothetical protein
MKPRFFILPLLAVNIILLVAVFMLYQKNKTYRSQNRELIIKNDSLLSANIKPLPQKPLAQEKTVIPQKKKSHKRG